MLNPLLYSVVIDKTIKEAKKALYKANMTINENKTKPMILGNGDKTHNIELHEKRLEQVKSFKYVDSTPGGGNERKSEHEAIS